MTRRDYLNPDYPPALCDEAERAAKTAKPLHPASIAARARRTNLAVAHNKAHAALDGATWAQLNGVQL